MTAGELRDAIWMISVYERWNMSREEADKWRRRIVARHAFLALPDDVDRLA